MVELTGSTTLVYHGVLVHQPLGGYPELDFHPVTLESPVFAAGSHYWCARIVCHRMFGGRSSFSMSLQLCSRAVVEVKASWELSVIDPLCVLPPTRLYYTPPPARSFRPTSRLCWDLDTTDLGAHCFGYVRNNAQLVFQVTVRVEDPEAAAPMGQVVVPPSDMLRQLGEVLATGDGADVTYSVDGVLFPCHRILLTMRSPVFRAQLFGEMRESGAQQQPIEIGDMRARTFRALLRYIYTDASPAEDEEEEEEEEEEAAAAEASQDDDKEVRDLLAAADRFGVDRLKLICQRVLCERLEVENVAETLEFADRHHCDTLKDACIEFMTTSNRMDQVKTTQGYLRLRNSDHADLLFQVLEKSNGCPCVVTGASTNLKRTRPW